jgi:hypothetical protein
MCIQPTGVSTFASRTSQSTNQSLQKSFHLSHVDKIELKKISIPSENKKYATAQPTDRQKSVAMQTPKPLTGKRFNYSVDRRPACNITYTQAGVSCFVGKESGKFKVQFFVGSSVVKIPACV